jgi:hypothetical protein
VQNPLFKAATDSAKAGVLSPIETDYRDPNDVLRLYLSALTGIDPTLVRKRWLSEPGDQPPIAVDWAAVGVDRVTTWGTPFIEGRKPETISDPDDVQQTSWQTLWCVASFYGPNAADLADLFRSALLVPQNDAALRQYGLTTQGVEDDVIHVPDLLFQHWVDRYDVTFKVGRSVTRSFGVRAIVAAGVNILTEKTYVPSDPAGQ